MLADGPAADANISVGSHVIRVDGH
eukprot:COSAG02_NODE_54330_length_296_cov_1.314721_1_plen_24_part_01